jgi:hypothetical protein
MPNLRDPLLGCLFEPSVRWRGLQRVASLIGVLDVNAWTEKLKQHPGVVWSKAGIRPGKREEEGWYVPQSLIDMGRWPAGVWDWPPCETPNMPNGAPLMRVQRHAVSFLLACTPEREGVILGGDMGLGKGNTALQALWLKGLLQERGIVMGPLNTRAAWVGPGSDAARYFGLSINPLEGEAPDLNALDRHLHHFVHIDILKHWQGALFGFKPRWLIFDEGHLLCHGSADRTTAAYNLSLGGFIDVRYMLTGTPIPNDRLDLAWMLMLVQPMQWGQREIPFGMRYCSGKREQNETRGASYIVYDEDETPEDRLLELRARLAGTLLRYTKADAQEELPELERVIVDLTFENDPALEERYDRIEHDIAKYLRETGAAPVGAATVTFGYLTIKLTQADQTPQALELRMISELLGVISEFKAVQAAKIVEQLMSCHTANKLVSFSWRIAGARSITACLARVQPPETEEQDRWELHGPIDGSVPQETRQAEAAAFAADERSVYVATLGAAGISINELQVADTVVFSDLHWKTVVLLQAESRAHRKGNPNAKVRALYLRVRGTIDDFLVAKLLEKGKAAASVSPNDSDGLNLVGDLVPSTRNAGGERDLDTICQLLAHMED